MKKFSLFFFLLCTLFNSIAQSNRVNLEGTLFDSNSVGIAQAHIINLSTNIGTISNSKGQFRISVKRGDWLQITNLQYHQKKVLIHRTNITTKSKIIYLISIINQLDEVVLKKKLTGILKYDRTDKPKDSLPKIGKSLFDVSESYITAIDRSIKKVKNREEMNSAIQNTDPTRKFAPVTIASAGIPDKSSKRKIALRKRLNFKQDFPNKLKQLFGDHFFFVKLKIPKDKYYHFLEYCNPLGIEALYKREKHLDVLNILLKESKSYLLLLENNK